MLPSQGSDNDEEDGDDDDLLVHGEEAELLVQLQLLHTKLAAFRATSPASGDHMTEMEVGKHAQTCRMMHGQSSKCPRFIEEPNKLIVCAVRRPVRLSRSRVGDSWVYRSSQSGFKSSIDYIAKTNRVQWVSWPGIHIEDRGTQEIVRKRLETDYGTYPIFMSHSTQVLFEGFCMDTLWPNLHGIPTDFNEKLRPALQQQQYDAFAYVSQLYLEKVCEVYDEGDIILVYDYELMLLPAQIRRRFPDVTCGFFLHTPFPSSELFQELPVRANILHGVLGADVIAFNHFDYVRHFQNACTRILGLESNPTFEAERHYSFEYDGRLICLEICPAGIDPNKFGLFSREDQTVPESIFPCQSAVNDDCGGVNDTCDCVHGDMKVCDRWEEHPRLKQVDHTTLDLYGTSNNAIPVIASRGRAATFIASAVAAIASFTSSSSSSISSSLPPSFPGTETAGQAGTSSSHSRSNIAFQRSNGASKPGLESQQAVELMKQLVRRFQRDGGKLIISLDRLDWCKGLPQKLISIESLYERYPQWRKKVTFFMVVREQDGVMKQDRNLRQMVNRLVGKVRTHVSIFLSSNLISND